VRRRPDPARITAARPDGGACTVRPGPQDPFVAPQRCGPLVLPAAYDPFAEPEPYGPLVLPDAHCPLVAPAP